MSKLLKEIEELNKKAEELKKEYYRLIGIMNQSPDGMMDATKCFEQYERCMEQINLLNKIYNEHLT